MYQEIRKPDSLWLNINGLRHHIRHWHHPQGQKILFLHGWMDVSASFQFVVDALQYDWDIYALDWRGMGLSEQQKFAYYDRAIMLSDLHQCIHHISPNETIHLVGHSLGGMIASQYSGLFSQKLRSLVVAEGFGINNESFSYGARKLQRFIEGMHKTPEFSPIKSKQYFIQKLLQKNPLLTEDKANYLSNHLLKQDNQGQWQHQADAKHKILQPQAYQLDWVEFFWQKITAPILWLRGDFVDHNHYLNSIHKSLQYRWEQYQQPKTHIFSGCGHMLQWEAPQEFAQAIEDFWLNT